VRAPVKTASRIDRPQPFASLAAGAVTIAGAAPAAGAGGGPGRVLQPEQRATPFRDGATGWHAVTVTVGRR
jgi:hypothetical protein